MLEYHSITAVLTRYRYFLAKKSNESTKGTTQCSLFNV